MLKGFSWSTSGVILLSLITGHCFALSPAVAEQSTLTIPRQQMNARLNQSVNGNAVKTNHQPTDAQSARIKQMLNSPELKALILKLFKHPDFTATAKSINSPAAVPFQWGGIGIASDTFSRYASQRHVSYKSGISAALPFGDSDESIGGVVSIGTAQLQPLSPPSALTRFGHQGSVGLGVSRWLLPRTIATAGVSNLIPWGEGAKSMGKSYYGALTQYMGFTALQSRHAVSASIGLGTGAFSPYSAFTSNGQLKAQTDHNGTLFINSAVNLTNDLALVGDYYSHTYAVGLAYNSTYLVPLNFMLYAANLKTSRLAPSSYVGLRVSLGVPFALFKRN